MTLHEAIFKVLQDHKRPMSVDDIAGVINAENYYERRDRESLTGSQVFLRVKNYPSLFENVNGLIILADDYSWKNIITSYWYIKEMLRGIFSESEIQFITAGLFFYKRLIDINERSGRRYPIDLMEKESSIEKLIDGSKSWGESLKLIDDFYIAPPGVFSDLSKEILKLDPYKREGIRNIISQTDSSSLSDFEFGNMYEYLLYLSSKEYFGYENSTPESIRILIPKLLNFTAGDSIYDPVSGLGGLLSKVYNENQNVQLKGSEINKRVAQLGNMNLLMHGVSNSSSIVAEDCFEEINSSQEYDFIIGDLPTNGITNSYEHAVLYNQFGIQLPKAENSFNSLVLFSFHKLSYKGKAILTVSDSFLTKVGREKQIRKILIENDVIEAVISLPKGTYRPYTESKASILIINRNKPYSLINKIKFIKIPPIEESKKSFILNNEQIVSEYFNEATNQKFTQIIDLFDLDNDLSLSAEKYDIQFSIANSMLKEGIAKQIKDVAYVISGKQPSKNEVSNTGELPIIKIENLSKDILDINLSINPSELDSVNNLPKYSNSTISTECILIAKIGDNLKPTIFRPSQQLPKILIHSGVLALIPKEDIDIDLSYLYYQLNSSFIEEQINTKRSNALMPYINKTDIEKIVIPFESIELQKKFINTQKANLIADESKKFEERKVALGYEEETKQVESDVIKILTHQLRPTFSGLNSITNRIQRIIERENLKDLQEYENIVLAADPEIEEYISVPDNYTLKQLIEKLSKETKHLSDILTNVDMVMNFKLLPEDLKEENLLKFLNEYKDEKAVEQNGKYVVEIKGDSAVAPIHKPSFKELLDQLLINAEKHAFVTTDINHLNKIQFTVKYIKSKEVVVIEYSNNGKPYELTQRDFITAFEKGNKSNGSGIGGNYISRIVEAHKGKLVIQEQNKKGFTLTIELPTINNEIYE